jgi:hypothetical protein
MAVIHSTRPGIKPASQLKAGPLGSAKDKVPGASARVLLVGGATEAGRNEVTMPFLLRSDFCAVEATARLEHNLWGWRVASIRPSWE